LGYLLNLEGHWEANVSLTMGEAKEKAMYYVDFSNTSDGAGVLMTEKCDIPGVGKMIGTNLVGYDPNDGKIHWYTVDNIGTTHEHIGTFLDPRHFTMSHHSLQNGKPYVEDIAMSLQGNGMLNLKVVATLDGQVQEIIEGTFVKSSKTAYSNPGR
jgi:hypothetical protein